MLGALITLAPVVTFHSGSWFDNLARFSLSKYWLVFEEAIAKLRSVLCRTIA
jgi:hypothetical protein